VPLSLAALGLAYFVLRETPRREREPLDLAGAGTLAGATVSALLALTIGSRLGYDSPVVVALFVSAPLLLWWFVRIEGRAEQPLLPLRFFRTRNFSASLAAQFCANFAYMGGFFLIPQVLGVRGLGLGEATTGYLVIARPLAFSLTAPLAALVTIRVGERSAGVAGAIGVMISMVMWSTVGHGTGYPYIIAATAMSGVGLGIASPALTALMVNAVATEDVGVAGAMQQLMTQLGAVLGAAVLATISVTATTTNMQPFHTAFWVAAVVSLAAAGAAGFVRSTPRE